MAHRFATILAAVAVLLPAAARGESVEARSILLWPVDGASPDAVASTGERLARLGAPVELPPPAPQGATPEALELQAAASSRVERARALYYEASFGEAAAALRSYLDEAGPRLAGAGCLESLRTALLWLGAALAKAGRADEAAAAFVVAVRLGLDEIDRSLFAPEVTAAFEAARRSAETAPTTAVTVSVSPPGDSLIEVDGTPAPAPPADAGAVRLDLGRGGHVVVARRPGFEPAARLIEVGDEPVAIELTLAPASRELLLRQVSELRRDGALDPADPGHVALAASAAGADLVAVVGPGAAVRLLDGGGATAAWPEEPRVEEPAVPEEPEAPREPTPVWRRWWFWVSLVGGAAVMATGVGLGVHYGTQNHDTFTLVPGE
jgi:hypothetical protein